MSIDFLSKCRTCLSESSFFHQLFDYVDENYKILEMLDCIAPQIDIKCNTQFSTLICQPCVNKLLMGYKFQQLCIETNIRLLDLLGIAGFETQPKLEKVLDPLTEETNLNMKQEVEDDVCYKQDITANELEMSMRSDNDDDWEPLASSGSDSKEMLRFQCPDCLKCFERKTSLSAHYKVHREKHDSKPLYKARKVDTNTTVDQNEIANNTQENEPRVCVKEEYEITPQIIKENVDESETNGELFNNNSENSDDESDKNLFVKRVKSNKVVDFKDAGVAKTKSIKMKPLTTSQKDLLIHDRENGMKMKELSVKYKISESGVKKIIALYKIRKSNESLKKLCGRKRKTTKKDDDHIAILAKKNTFTSAKEIKEELNLNISSRTVQRRLNESGLKSTFVIKRPLLSAENILERLEFAKKYINMPEIFWNKVVWTGEWKFELKNAKKPKRVWCETSQSLKSKNIVHTVKDGGEILMVWGCFCSSGVGRLVKIDRKMTAEDYVTILRENLYSSAEEMGLGDFVFQQDNDLKHTSEMAKKYFEQNNIEKLDWPAKSPDINPIEQLWAILNEKISTNPRRNMQTLWEEMEIEWRAIPSTTLKNLTISMPKRLKQVIQNNGGAISY